MSNIRPYQLALLDTKLESFIIGHFKPKVCSPKLFAKSLTVDDSKVQYTLYCFYSVITFVKCVQVCI